MTDHEKTSDAVKITKHLYGEPSQESRNELAADDLHEKLVAACEAVGMEAYSDDTTLDGEKRLPFSATRGLWSRKKAAKRLSRPY